MNEHKRVQEWRYLSRLDLARQLEYVNRQELVEGPTAVSATCFKAQYRSEGVLFNVYLHGYERTVVEVV
jgi:hypothetical protein